MMFQEAVPHVHTDSVLRSSVLVLATASAGAVNTAAAGAARVQRSTAVPHGFLRTGDKAKATESSSAPAVPPVNLPLSKDGFSVVHDYAQPPASLLAKL